jgi:hypothetical protein
MWACTGFYNATMLVNSAQRRTGFKPKPTLLKSRNGSPINNPLSVLEKLDAPLRYEIRLDVLPQQTQDASAFSDLLRPETPAHKVTERKPRRKTRPPCDKPRRYTPAIAGNRNASAVTLDSNSPPTGRENESKTNYAIRWETDPISCRPSLLFA